jgi:hypothetical protein
MSQKLYLIDTTAPFASVVPEDKETNWSKAPFERLETYDAPDPAKFAQVENAFESYLRTVSEIGYTAIALDDLAHAVNYDFYPAELKSKIEFYQRFYDRIIEKARSLNLQVFFTSDIMYFNEHIDRHVSRRRNGALRLFSASVRSVFRRFPDISGVIIRLGESDGLDVTGTFKSRLVVHTPGQCRRFLKRVLPTFEKYDKTLIVRTWTLGAFPVGDLMWNRKTFEEVFGRIYSDNLIVSHKYGETDFFRYLNMNPLFFDSPVRQIMELQSRREYEGFGEFPSFVGHDYERYARYLSTCENVVGISVWCQTGGWSHFTGLTFLRNSSLWNEINTFVTLRIFKNGSSAEQAVKDFAERYLPHTDVEALLVLLRLSDRVVKELWYIPEFSQRRMYFRRTRVPPLLWIFWDTILINHTLRKIIRRFVHERTEAIQDGYRALHKIRRMKKFAAKAGIDTAPFDYQYATFKIVALSREYYLGKWDPKIPRRIIREVEAYRRKYPHGFHVVYDFSPVRFKKWLIKGLFKLSLRSHPHYRLIDRILIIRLAGLVYPVFHLWSRKRMPDFSHEQAMGLQVLFK